MLNGAAPAFDLDQGELLLALMRGLAVASLLSLFGSLVFACVVAPRAWARLERQEQAGLRRRLRRWTSLGLAGAIVLLLAWVPLEAGSIAGASTLPAVLAAVPAVATGTRFGQLAMLQLAFLLAASWAVWRRWPLWIATATAGLVLVLHVGHTHAPAMQAGLSLLVVSDAVHLLAGGAWLGGLVPLLLMVRHAPPRVAAGMCRYYSPLGKWCLVAVLATASIQFWQLIGGVPGLVGTAYGWMAMTKIGLFGVLFGFALVNRYRLAPALMRADPAPSRRRLQRSIALQTVAALAVVLAAGVLAQLSPSIHDQPVWPFADQFSLVTVREDPEFRDEVLRAGAMLVGAVILLAAGLVWRRRRFGWLAVIAALALAVPAVPHLGLLVVPATPTSFFRSPTGFAAGSIVAGAALYPRHCAACHGAEGQGHGPLASTLPVPPADLTAPHLWEHPDGELFWWLAHGMEAPEGGLAMPGFSPALGDSDLWALIDFIRAHNAGVTHAATGAWSTPVQAPGFQMRCGDGSTPTLEDLRGRIVRLVFAADASVVPGVVTVLAGAAKPQGADRCVVDDGALLAATGIVSGSNPGGSEVLIDAAGWIREIHAVADEASWLPAALREVAAHPLAAVAVGHHHH